MGDAAFIDAVQTIAIVANTGALIYVIVRFDQAIRGADRGLRAAITKTDEARGEARQEFDRVWRRIERIEADIETKGRRREP